MVLKRRKIRAKKLKGIPRVKLKKLGRPLARDVKQAARIGKKITKTKVGGIRKPKVAILSNKGFKLAQKRKRETERFFASRGISLKKSKRRSKGRKK